MYTPLVDYIKNHNTAQRAVKETVTLSMYYVHVQNVVALSAISLSVGNVAHNISFSKQVSSDERPTAVLRTTKPSLSHQAQEP